MTTHTHIFSKPITVAAAPHKDEYACAAHNPNSRDLLTVMQGNAAKYQREALDNQENVSVALCAANTFAHLLAMYLSEGTEVEVTEVQFSAEHTLFLAATLEDGVQVESADWFWVHNGELGGVEMNYEPFPGVVDSNDKAKYAEYLAWDSMKNVPEDIQEFLVLEG